MNRRSFFTMATLLSLAPGLSFAQELTDYTPGLVQSELAAGKTVFVEYSAVWCSTCARQERIINALRAANPDYDTAMSFIKVDWDTYGRHDVSTSRAIPRRSTLVLLRGDEELGRIVAGTAEGQIKDLMDLGL